MDLVEDSTQGWQWFCLSSRFDSCAALLSLLSLNMSSLTCVLCVYALIERTDSSVFVWLSFSYHALYYRILYSYVCIYRHASCY